MLGRLNACTESGCSKHSSTSVLGCEPLLLCAFQHASVQGAWGGASLVRQLWTLTYLLLLSMLCCALLRCALVIQGEPCGEWRSWHSCEHYCAAPTAQSCFSTCIPDESYQLVLSADMQCVIAPASLNLGSRFGKAAPASSSAASHSTPSMMTVICVCCQCAGSWWQH